MAGGYNGSGQCAVQDPNTGFTAIAAGRYHSLGLKTDGSIVAWGRNSEGQYTVPSPNTGFTAIAAGGYHSLGLKGCLFDLAGDLNDDCKVDMLDFAIMASNWLLYELSADVVPDGGDGFVNFSDFTDFSSTWQGTSEDMAKLFTFSEQWLQVGATSAEVTPFDIAPPPDGDRIVNFLDFTVLANHWLLED